MNPKLSFRMMLSAILLLVCVTPAQGVYRGPGNVVPPNLAPPAAVARGPGPVGIGLIGPDLSAWQFWWEFNKERFLHESRRGPRTGISAKVITDEILPALRKMTEDGVPASIQATSLVALAKLDPKSERAKLRKLLLGGVANSARQVRESAVLAMGIAAMSETVLDLEALARDTDRGRELAGVAAVDERLRAFACYSLGLVANRSADLYVKRRVFKTLQAILDGGSSRSSFDIQVAAISGISILNISTEQRVVGNRELLLDVLAGLHRVRGRKALNAAVTSHVPGAIAKLIGRGHDEVHQKCKTRLMAVVPNPEMGNNTRRAAILALGQISEPAEIHAGDKEISTILQDCFRTGRDEQSRYFALVALGQIGGNDNRDCLLRVLSRGKKSVERPWAAIALGVLESRRRRQDPRATPDEEIGGMLVAQLKGIKNPTTRSAIAVALGMCRYQPAAPALVASIRKHRSKDDFCGYLCVGLALLGHKDAAVTVRDIVKVSVRRPYLQRAAVAALGALRDRASTGMLVDLLKLNTSNLGRLSAVAGALGSIDDPKAVSALIEILEDRKRSRVSRACAAAALGGVADPDPLPFYWGIADNLNYRAAVQTMVYFGEGLLERL